MTALENELKQLIIESLYLESLTVHDIESEAPLFNTGLGLDSVDALELALALERRFGVTIRSDDDNVKEIFASVRSLAAHIARHRRDPGAAP